MYIVSKYFIIIIIIIIIIVVVIIIVIIIYRLCTAYLQLFVYTFLVPQTNHALRVYNIAASM